MNLAWFQQSIGRKAMALVCLVSAVVFLALFLVTRTWQRNMAIDRIERSERQFSGAMKLALDGAMAQGDKEQMNEFFRRTGELSRDTAIHLVVPGKKVGFSSHPNQINSDAASLLPEGELRDSLEGSLSRQVEVGKLAELNGITHYVHLKSIANEPRCYGCHDQSKAILGSMVLLQDMSTDWKAMGLQSWVLGGLSITGMVLLVVSLGFFIRLGITRPLAGFGGVLDQVALGDLRQELVMDSQDEIGNMGRALGKTIRSLRSALGEVKRSEQKVSASSNQLSKIFTQMEADTRETSAKASTVAAAAEEMSVSTASVAAAMEQATTNFASISESTSQMTSTIAEIARNSEKARTITGAANRQAEGMSALMKELGRAAQEIGQVTETINGISSQTNLLALNATIEAARAGAAGKGFAVVAGEIKELAQQTATATEDIKAKIADIQHSTSGAVGDIQRISEVIREVSDVVSTIATAIEEQSAVTRDIAGNLAQASQGVREANQRVAQTSTVTQEIARDIAAVDQAARQMNESVRKSHGNTVEMTVMAEQLNMIVSTFQFENASGKSANKGSANFASFTDAHLKWKVRLHQTIAGTSSETLDPSAIARDNVCEMGKWIHGEGQKLSGNPDFQHLIEEHAAFHKCAGKIASLSNSGQKHAAEALLTSDEYNNLTKAVVVRLRHMDESV